MRYLLNLPAFPVKLEIFKNTGIPGTFNSFSAPNTPMKLHIPNSAFLGNIEPFISSFDLSEPEQLEITSNEKWISVHPMVLSMLLSLGLSVGKKNVSFGELKAKSRPYLERMGLFKELGVDSGISIVEHEPSGRFIPLSRISDSEELTQFITEMVPLLHTDAEHSEPIKYVISELVRNVFEHSESPHGAIVCAQFYKKSNRIAIGVADAGIGIKESISVSHNPENDLEAIRLALTPGVTGTTSRSGGTELNAGAGLFFIKSIAKVNRDFFVMYSGSSLYKLLKTPPNKKIKLFSDPFSDRCTKREHLPYWKGTAVGMDISLDQHQDFDHLLDLIRNVYYKDIKKRKKEKVWRPRFI